MPFFLEPWYHSNINLTLPTGTPALTDNPKEVVEYGPWLFRKMTLFAEYRDLIERSAKEGATLY